MLKAPETGKERKGGDSGYQGLEPVEPLIDWAWGRGMGDAQTGRDLGWPPVTLRSARDLD